MIPVSCDKGRCRNGIKLGLNRPYGGMMIVDLADIVHVTLSGSIHKSVRH
jgi:hypothetical protein